MPDPVAAIGTGAGGNKTAVSVQLGELLGEKPPAHKPGPGRGKKGGSAGEPP